MTRPDPEILNYYGSSPEVDTPAAPSQPSQAVDIDRWWEQNYLKVCGTMVVLALLVVAILAAVAEEPRKPTPSPLEDKSGYLVR